MNYPFWDLMLEVLEKVVLLGSVAVSIYLYRKSRSRALEAAMQRGDTRLSREIAAMRDGQARQMAGLNTRVSVLEQRIADMPTHKDLRELRDLVAESNERVAALDERSIRTDAMVQRIHQHLLES